MLIAPEIDGAVANILLFLVPAIRSVRHIIRAQCRAAILAAQRAEVEEAIWDDQRRAEERRVLEPLTSID